MFLETFYTAGKKIYTATGSDGIDKFHLWYKVMFVGRYIKTILQGDVGERFVGGVFLPAGKEGRVAREEDVRENSNRPHVWNAN